MVRDFRKDVVPQDVIVLWDKVGGIPTDYAEYASLYGKYLKNVTDACDNPGDLVGASTHTHSCSSTHTHPASPSDGAHTHAAPLASVLNATGPAGTGCPMSPSDGANPHTHGGTTGTGTTTVTVDSTGGHTHDAQSNTDADIKMKFIQKTSVVNLRRKVIPFKGTILYRNTVALVPSNYSLHASLVNRFIKGVDCASDCPLVTGGSDTHTHDSQGHTHSAAGPSHTHASSNSGGSGLPMGILRNTGVGSTQPNNHGHPIPASGAATIPATDSDSDGHTHGSKDDKPPFFDFGYIQQNVIDFRKSGIIPDGVVVWDGTLATIPNEFRLQDGSCGTDNTLDKFSHAIVNVCTNPGATGGSATHTHDSDTHTHAVVLANHNHPQPSATANPGFNSPGPAGAVGSHGHPITGGCRLVPITLTVDSGHTHDGQTNLPESREEAFIQRLI